VESGGPKEAQVIIIIIVIIVIIIHIMIHITVIKFTVMKAVSLSEVDI